jgi:uncharacterized membrane protein YqhA
VAQAVRKVDLAQKALVVQAVRKVDLVLVAQAMVSF